MPSHYCDTMVKTTMKALMGRAWKSAASIDIKEALASSGYSVRETPMGLGAVRHLGEHRRYHVNIEVCPHDQKVYGSCLFDAHIDRGTGKDRTRHSITGSSPGLSEEIMQIKKYIKTAIE